MQLVSEKFRLNGVAMKNSASEKPILWTILQYCHAAEAPPLPVPFICTMKNGVKLVMQYHCDMWITFMQHIRAYKVRLCQVCAMNDEIKLINFDMQYIRVHNLQPKIVIAYT